MARRVRAIAGEVKPPSQLQKSEHFVQLTLAGEHDDEQNLAFLAYMTFCTSGAGSSGKKNAHHQARVPFLRYYDPNDGKKERACALWKNKTRPPLERALKEFEGFEKYEFVERVEWPLQATVGSADHGDIEPEDMTTTLLDSMQKLPEDLTKPLRDSMRKLPQDLTVWDQEQGEWNPFLVPQCLKYRRADGGIFYEMGLPKRCFKQQGREATKRQKLGHSNVSASAVIDPAAFSHATYDNASESDKAFADDCLRGGSGLRSGTRGEWWKVEEVPPRAKMQQTMFDKMPAPAQVLMYLTKTIVSSVRQIWLQSSKSVKIS